MKKLREEEPDAYKRQFGDYIKARVEPEQIEAMWTNAHNMIRKDPVYKPTKKPENPVHKRYKPKKKTLKERKDRVKQKLAALKKAAQVAT
jgi:large subunit ribosomal protein L5e